MEKYIVEQIDDFFGVFSNNKNKDLNRLLIPYKMIKVPLSKGDVVEIERNDKVYQINVL